MEESRPPGHQGWHRAYHWLLERKTQVLIVAALVAGLGASAAPFWRLPWLPDGVRLRVDALPDMSDNQQVVFTEWPGRSARDVEDQITHPLSALFLSLPGVITVRGTSNAGLSSLYVIFEDRVDFSWAQSRVGEKLARLGPQTLPPGVTPVLGPDANALGQILWYTIEALDEHGKPSPDWDLSELRTVHDAVVRPALQLVPGVAEVASIGGQTRELQVNVNPQALHEQHVDLDAAVAAVRAADRTVGARTLEINRVEYMLRGTGRVAEPSDLENAVVVTRDGRRVLLGSLAHVSFGAAPRIGALDDAGTRSVGGVVAARIGSDPVRVIAEVKRKLAEIAPGLAAHRAADGRIGRFVVEPYYDRSTLIEETLATLSSGMWQQILVTVLVVLLLMRALSGALLISAVVPLAVLCTFAAMAAFGVEVNFMALAGISIAVGTMVDMGIVMTENIVRTLRLSPDTPRLEAFATATAEVAPAVLTAGLTTAISFVPVFAFTGTEGKLFAPMAYTKTFAMTAAMLVSILVLPALGYFVLHPAPVRLARLAAGVRFVVIGAVAVTMTTQWMPLGATRGLAQNLAFVAGIMLVVFALLTLFRRLFAVTLGWLLGHKTWAVSVPSVFVLLGAWAWHDLDREFMPPFDEGAFLYMPSMAEHLAVGETMGMLSEIDAGIKSIPEVDRVVGKLGRAESALDPAPSSMVETIVTYKPEYSVRGGKVVRNWRDHIRRPEDIWQEIHGLIRAPGLTAAPMLMPIGARVQMLQTGLRAATAVKLYGRDLTQLEQLGLSIERLLKELPELRADTVYAERINGGPMLSIEPKRSALAAAGVTMAEVQNTIETAVSGQLVMNTVLDAVNVATRVRYEPAATSGVEALGALGVPTPQGQVPLAALADLRYLRSPRTVSSENGRMTSFILFDRAPGIGDVEAVEAVKRRIEAAISRREITLPAGTTFELAGTYTNHLRSTHRLLLLIPLALAIIAFVVHREFRRLARTLIVLGCMAVCMAGGFILVWAYNKPWFLSLKLFGVDWRDLFQVGTVNLSVAVWVGFIALLGIATDAGVVVGMFLGEAYDTHPPRTVAEVRAMAVAAAERRLLPCLMTTAAAALALLPVLTSHGRGASLLLPMALPSIGGMATVLLTLFTVPVLFAWLEERRLR